MIQQSDRIPLCDEPVFVIGAPRSATTVFGQALARHSRYWASDETFILFDLNANDRLGKSFQRWIGRPSSSWLRREGVELDEFLDYMGLGWNALFTSRSQGRRWVDHTPHHALIADLLARMFPGARFLHLLRDGREVVDSMTHVDRTMTPDEKEDMAKKGFLPKWGLDFREACRTWSRSVTAARDFGESCPRRYRVVPVQELRADPHRTFAEVHAFLGVEDEEGPGDYCAKTRMNSSFSERKGGTSVPLERPEPWVDWSDEQRDIFREEAGEVLVRTGLASEDELEAEGRLVGEGRSDGR